MAYVVLARKWRPQRFSDVLGQEHVTQTLTNAIAAQRIAHAFLFSGPRGVGKTSAARILSKALCCEASEGPTAEPCGTCRQCTEITEGRSTDVFEIDAASHTGVDNVREIIDNARYLPSSARFKIYVIDEVHMLSVPAFNALLKTLEEPPGHVKFVLATTDVHKVPVTVKSRCQRYDFRRIALSRISERLSFILEEEGIEHERSALSLVAREAEGSMRDAQSLLEQVLAFAGDRRLEAPLVREALGVVDSALVDRARIALLERHPGALIEVVQDVHARGLDLSRFIGAIIEHVRDLLAAKVVQDPKLVLDRPEDEIASLVAEGEKVSTETLERLFDQLCRIAEEVGRSSRPRFALEVGLAALADRPLHVPMDQLVAQLERVESLIAGAPASPGGRAPRRGPPQGPPGQDRTGGGPRRGPEPGRPSAPSGVSRPREPGASRRAPGAPPGEGEPSEPSGPPRETARPEAAPPTPSAPAALDASSRTAARPPAPPASPATTPPAPAPASGPEAPPWVTEEIPLADEPRGAPSDPPPAPTSTPAPRRPPPAQTLEPAPPPADDDSGPVWLRFEEPYAQFVAFVRRKRPAIAATLMQVRPLAFGPDGVRLGCETAFDLRKLESRDTRALLEGLLEAHLGVAAPVHVQRGTDPKVRQEKKTLIEVEDEHAAQVRKAKAAAARDDEGVNAVLEALSGKISNVRVID